MTGRSVEVTLLGNTQDGGYPQVGCLKDCCMKVRGNVSLSRMPVSLGLKGADGLTHMVEASRMMSQQFDLWNSLGAVSWPPSSFTLTHAHLGHIDGLGLLGREVMGLSGVRLHCSDSMSRLLRKTPSWNIMIEQGVIDLDIWIPGVPFEPSVGCGFTITAIPIPHRSELSDNHALIIRGKSKSLLFMPDQDSWMETIIEDIGIVEWLNRMDIDIALIDGTFWDYDEISSRDFTEIPHPPVTETLDRLGVKKNGDPDIEFTHFNHTNPLLEMNSVQSKRLLSMGWGISEQGRVYRL
ncbi:MAG: hypothetical protein CMA26_03770 [Euryarchaeota archaeon]|nr:hypothetical protein [Euryarchaeota archaeon]